MPKRVAVEDLIIPPQDQRICGTICICQLTLILSAVALVYLTVAIYVPSTKVFTSGISEDPAMCTTIQAINKTNTTWCSCSEWCLSKTSGACIQILVHLRNHGDHLSFANCSHSTNRICYGIDQEMATHYRCINGSCNNLTGTYNCTMGECINITDSFECRYKFRGAPLNCHKRRGRVICQNITGLFDCLDGVCRKIRIPYNCERRCINIPTRNKNVIIMMGDKIFVSQCDNVRNVNTELEIWNKSESNIFITSCYDIENNSENIKATDCLNGSVLNKNYLTDQTNFTHLSYLYGEVARPIETIPLEQDLTIVNESRLFINLEGCVNTLRDECKAFFKRYGKDGGDYMAKARFPCYFSKNDMTTVVTNFSLATARNQFIIAFVIPGILFIVSCLVLIVYQRHIIVGDDAKMRFKNTKENILASNESMKNIKDDVKPTNL